MFVGVAFTYFHLLPPAAGVLSHISPRDTDTGAVGAPSLYQSPRFRWWWPGGWIEPDEVQSEITAIIDAGFGGAEIGDVEDSIKVEMDPQVYGWAQSRWNTGVAAACEQADRFGHSLHSSTNPKHYWGGLTIGLGNGQLGWTLRPDSWPALANRVPWIHSRLP